MARQVFERKEVKYIITAAQREAMLGLMSGHMQADSYGLKTICNVYFDTPSHMLIRNSIEKPLYKEKLRLRTYGVPEDGSGAFVELKKKFEGIVYKRREVMPYAEAWAFLAEGRAPSRDSQVLREIAFALRRYEGIAPAMALFYDRIAYADREDPDLRLTFDSGLVYRTCDLDLRNGAYGSTFLDPERCIMEIKILHAMPLWMASALDKLGIYPGSYSKYGAAYKLSLAEGAGRQGEAHGSPQAIHSL